MPGQRLQPSAADCGEYREVAGAIAEALMHGLQYNGVGDRSALGRAHHDRNPNFDRDCPTGCCCSRVVALSLTLGRGSHEGVLSGLPRSDRAGCNLVDCSQQSAGAGGPSICDAALYARRRLGRAKPKTLRHGQ
jgi:hypothetical protein